MRRAPDKAASQGCTMLQQTHVYVRIMGHNWCALFATPCSMRADNQSCSLSQRTAHFSCNEIATSYHPGSWSSCALCALLMCVCVRLCVVCRDVCAVCGRGRVRPGSRWGGGGGGSTTNTVGTVHQHLAQYVGCSAAGTVMQVINPPSSTPSIQMAPQMV